MCAKPLSLSFALPAPHTQYTPVRPLPRERGYICRGHRRGDVCKTRVAPALLLPGAGSPGAGAAADFAYPFVPSALARVAQSLAEQRGRQVSTKIPTRTIIGVKAIIDAGFVT